MRNEPVDAKSKGCGLDGHAAVIAAMVAGQDGMRDNSALSRIDWGFVNSKINEVFLGWDHGSSSP